MQGRRELGRADGRECCSPGARFACNTLEFESRACFNLSQSGAWHGGQVWAGSLQRKSGATDVSAVAAGTGRRACRLEDEIFAGHGAKHLCFVVLALAAKGVLTHKEALKLGCSRPVGSQGSLCSSGSAAPCNRPSHCTASACFLPGASRPSSITSGQPELGCALPATPAHGAFHAPPLDQHLLSCGCRPSHEFSHAGNLRIAS